MFPLCLFFLSFPLGAEWPGDGLESEMPVTTLASLLSTYARPYAFSEARDREQSKRQVRVDANVCPKSGQGKGADELSHE